jgi:cytoskeleton protein RodZ
MNTASQDDQQLNLPNMDLPLGVRLRRAREAAGLGVSEVAEKLRLKSVTIESLEREDFDALGAAVYVRGYFNSYAKLVGVPTVLIERAFATRAASAPELHTTARVSHSRYLFDRYAKRAVYVVLTASIVVPVILLATRNQLPQQGAMLTPLDAPVAIEGAPSSPATETATESATPDPAAAGIGSAPATLPKSAGETPVMASLGPFYTSAAEPAPAVPLMPGTLDAVPRTDVGVRLVLRGDSWVEVLGHDGRRLEHGLLRAGTTRDFAPGLVGRVSLGNADAVEVRMNGAVTDIAPYRRANVARFTVSSEGSLAPAGG